MLGALLEKKCLFFFQKKLNFFSPIFLNFFFQVLHWDFVFCSGKMLLQGKKLLPWFEFDFFLSFFKFWLFLFKSLNSKSKCWKNINNYSKLPQAFSLSASNSIMRFGKKIFISGIGQWYPHTLTPEIELTLLSFASCYLQQAFREFENIWEIWISTTMANCQMVKTSFSFCKQLNCEI